ncbi:MAG: hypothetical protein GVY13_01495 [Alphaproteobacteria bacterium]|jgi:hypothetical protein|nr:hypothetical protein [Alphaproteobacteria bacterium]
MAGFPRRWDEGFADGEDASIDVPAASLARVPIRTDERRCSRRKSGDLTFDPTTVNDDPDADLFASRRRGGTGEPGKGARHGGPAVLGAHGGNGSRRVSEPGTGPAGTGPGGTGPAGAGPAGPEPAAALGGAPAKANGADSCEVGAIPLPTDRRAALAQVKPAVRRRNPLIALNGGGDTPSLQTENQGEGAAAAKGMNGHAHAGPDHAGPDHAGPDHAGPPAPSPSEPAAEGRSGWRSTFSRWRRKIAFAAESPEKGREGETPDDAAARAPVPSRNSNLYDYWTQLRRGRKMPAWSEIRVDEVASAWPNSFIVSFEPKAGAEDGAQPLVRARRVTQDQPAGPEVEELRLTDTVIEWILATARAAVKHGEPVQDRESFAMHDGKLVYTIVAVPFSGDRSGVEHILCHLKPLARPGANRRAN